MSFDSETATHQKPDSNTTFQPNFPSGLDMFIPKRLHIANHPEIDELPLNLLFTNSKQQNGDLITGAALYLPDLSTLAIIGKRIAITYRNTLDNSWLVVVAYGCEGNITRSRVFRMENPVPSLISRKL
jgi:hypothetical protein